jgi:hypothetical protein
MFIEAFALKGKPEDNKDFSFLFVALNIKFKEYYILC